MTFEQALEIKTKLGSVIVYANKEWFLKIVPSDSADLFKYLEDIESKLMSDEDAKKYSSNNDFIIRRFLISYFKLQHAELDF